MTRLSVSLRNIFVTLLAVAPIACGAEPDPDSTGSKDGLTGEPTPKDCDPTSPCKVFPIGDSSTCWSPEELKKIAWDTCAKAGLELSDLSLGDACKVGFSSAKAVCCLPAPPPPPPPPQECFSDSQGDPTSCKTTATWKEYAYKACAEKGFNLTEYAVGEACGEDSFRYVKYQCCKDPEPPPPPPPDACFTDSQGDPTSCKTTTTWKEYAAKACSEKGYVLTEYAVGEACGEDSFRYVKYQCCAVKPPEPPPPPPPQECIADMFGDATSCKSSGTWKEYVANYCNDKGGYVINDFYLLEPCDKNIDGYRFVKFSCCKDVAPPPPPPPPPETCVANKAYEPVCQPSEYWSKVALSDCAAQGLSLNSFSVLFPCADQKAFQGATWECCKK